MQGLDVQSYAVVWIWMQGLDVHGSCSLAHCARAAMLLVALRGARKLGYKGMPQDVPRPRQSTHKNTATILHTPVQARQALNHHDKASTQHRRHAEHSQKACIWYKRRRNKAPPPPPIQGGHRGRQKARREGTGGKGGRGGGRGEGEAGEGLIKMCDVLIMIGHADR